MKKILVIGLSLLMAVSMAACGKEEEPEIIPEHNYAQNEVVEKTEEEVTEEVTATPTPTEEKPTKEELFPDRSYNAKDDTYINDVMDINTIAIDGQLCAFPCDFTYISEKYGPLVTKTVTKYIITTEVDGSEVGDAFTVYATPTTGTGSIGFKFVSKDDSNIPLSEMTCTGVILQAGQDDGSELMTLALPNWIKFGSTKDEIYEYFGQNTQPKSYTKNNDFLLIYSFDTYDITFTGYDGGLYNIDITYK